MEKEEEEEERDRERERERERESENGDLIYVRLRRSKFTYYSVALMQ